MNVKRSQLKAEMCKNLNPYDVAYFDELETINAVLDSIFEEWTPPETETSPQSTLPVSPICFWGRESYLSNFHPVVFNDVRNGYRYTSSEQFYMREKALYHRCFKEAALIKNTHCPYSIKKIGRSLPRSNGWYINEAIPTMYRAIYYKFNQNPELKKKLLDTETRIIIETTPYDDFWGVKCEPNDPSVINPARWKGYNYLGLLLMYLRQSLRKQIGTHQTYPHPDCIPMKFSLRSLMLNESPPSDPIPTMFTVQG